MEPPVGKEPMTKRERSPGMQRHDDVERIVREIQVARWVGWAGLVLALIALGILFAG